MRIKMQCPDCGKWFTLELSVKEQLASRVSAAHDGAEASGQVRNERKTAANGVARDRGDRRSAGRPAWLFTVAPVLVVAAVVLVWFFLIGPAIERSRTGIVLETSAATSDEPPAVLDDGVTDSDGAGVEGAGVKEAPGVDGAGGAAEPDDMEAPDAIADTPDVIADTPDAIADTPDAIADTPDAITETPDDSSGAPIVESVQQLDETPAPRGGRASPAAGGSGPLEFTLVATGRCWVHVVADGSIVSDLTLQPGERRSWRAERQIELAAGSGQSVEIYLNGEFLGTAGPDSRVVEGLVVTSEGFVARS